MEIKNENLLEIEELKVFTEELEILKNFNLKIKKGEIHVIMGPNGCGKSTLSKVLVGHPLYKVKEGNIIFKGKNLLDLKADERANLGLFLAFQYPLEISGLTNFDFLYFAYNQKQKSFQKAEFSPLEFLSYISPICEKLEIRKEFLYRNLNEGFSGGEKKKNEILQMFILNPDLIILDELDSGLDIDALRIIYQNITDYQNADSKKSFLIITHNFKVFDYIRPNFIHLMKNGKIVQTGDLSLISKLEDKGYNFLTE